MPATCSNTRPARTPDLKRRSLIGMPLLITGVVASMAVAHPSNAEVSHVAAPAYQASEPAITMIAKPKPKTRPGAWVVPLSGYRLTARFGASSGLWSSTHTGLDLAAPSGTPLRAITGAVVVSVGYDGAYGNKTVLRLPDGTELWYCHQSSTSVAVGQKVLPGQTIGTVGSTGNVTGPHLHLEVRPSEDSPVDPYASMAAHGVRL